jgi:ABC-type Fe3+/spermidine/putrescine transport system ATPase subunit
VQLADGIESGSRLEGTVAEIVYLGMYTQFHVDTPAGRIVSHRLADEPLEHVALGTAVVLTWEAEDSYVLADEPALLA